MKTNKFIILLAFFNFTCSPEVKNVEEVKSSSKAIDTVQKIEIDTTGADLSYISHLHKRKTFKLFDQTLVQYANSKPNRPDSIRNIIYISPLGDMSKEIEEFLNKEITYLEKFFQLKVKIMKRIPFYDLKKIDSVKTRLGSNRRGGKFEKMYPNNQNINEQIEANSLIEHYIISNKPKDAVVILGITDHDIYTPQFNYLFGTSNLKGGCGLVSTHRFQENPYEWQMTIRKVISKQITNLFSISNTKDYECLLNFANNLIEQENNVFYLSPIALQKLKINIGFDYKKRFEELRDYWKQTERTDMVNYYENCLKSKK